MAVALRMFRCRLRVESAEDSLLNSASPSSLMRAEPPTDNEDSKMRSKWVFPFYCMECMYVLISPKSSKYDKYSY